MILWGLALAFGGGLPHRPTRDPLPAREVERALTLPQGWTRWRLDLGRERWSDQRPRPFPGELERRSVRGAVAMGVGGGVTLRAALPWVSVDTGTVLGAGLGPATVGASWAPAVAVAPDRSFGLEADWTAPAPSPRLPLGPATHELDLGVAGRARWGALRLTARIGGRLAPGARVPWLTDATGRVQRLDPGEAVRGSLDGLFQAGPLLAGAGVDAAWVGLDRIDGVGVVAPGAVVTASGRGGLQLGRALTLGLQAEGVVRSRASLLAPADPLAPGRRVGAYVEVAL